MPRLVGDLLTRAAAAVPDKPALRTHQTTLTYREVAAAATAAGTCLQRAGVRPGDRVLVSHADRLTSVVWLLGALRIGAVFVVAAENAPAVLLRYLSDDAQVGAAVLAEGDSRAGALLPDVAVVTPGGIGTGEEPVCPAISTDLACLVYTSGTSSRPKGVMCPHRTVLFAVAAIAEQLGLRDDDVIGLLLPLTFDYGLYQIFLAFHARATIAIGTPADIPRVGRFLDEHGVTVLPLVPSLANRACRLLLRTPGGPPTGHVRLVTSTGERLHRSAVDQLGQAFPRADLVPMYGLTECKRVSILPPAELTAAPDSVGRALPDTEVLVVDPVSLEVLPPYSVGEIVARGPHVMAGYWRAPELTARRFRPWGPGGERALFTGDLGYVDEAGRLYVEGRCDDQFKVNGTRVSAAEVEHALRAVPDVVEAAVLPPSGDRLFTAVVAPAHRRLSGGEVRDRLAALLEPAKIPERVVLVDELPVGAHGKRDRMALLEKLAAVVDEPE